MAKYEAKACDARDCLRPATTKCYFSTPARFENLCDEHRPPVKFNRPGATEESE